MEEDKNTLNKDGLQNQPEDFALTKLRLNYAWKCFEGASKQRMTMFNFYLIITGILGNALVISYKEGYNFITFMISILGIFTSAGFCCFDLRNRGLVRLAGDILEKLENENIFPSVGNEKKTWGYIARDRESMGEGKKLPWNARVLKLKWWIRKFQILIGICFLLAALSLPFSNSSNNKRQARNQERTIIVLNPEAKTPRLSTDEEFSAAILLVQNNLANLKLAVQTLEQKIGDLRISIERADSVTHEANEHPDSLNPKTDNRKN